MTEPYIDDNHHYETSDRDKAIATHLHHLAKRLVASAKRFEPNCNPWDSLRGSSLSVGEIEDTALKAQVVEYVKKNYGKIGDISMAYGLINLVRFGSQYYRGV